MVKKKLFAALSIATVAIAGVGAIALSNNIDFVSADEKTQTVVLNAETGLSATSDAGTGHVFDFVATGLTETEGKLGTLAAGGFITLAEGHSLNQLDNIVVDVEGGDASGLRVWTAFEENNWVRNNLKFDEQTLSLTAERANYVKISAITETIINSIQFTFVSDGSACQTKVEQPSAYETTGWVVIGNHTSSQWDWNNTTPINELNIDNGDINYVEFKTSFVGIGGTAFKVVNGTSWDDYVEAETTYDTKYFYKTDGGDIVVNDESKKTETTEAVGAYHYIDIYLKVTSSKVSAYVALGEALENPVDLEDETLVKDIYFELPEGWATTVYAHYWDYYGNTTEWPGVALQLVSGNTYKTTLNTSFYSNIKFHDNGENSIEAKLPTNESNYFTNGAWIVFGEEVTLQTVYCYAPEWNVVKMHGWDGSAENTTWPGLSMTAVEGKEGYWEVSFVEGSYSKITFNNDGKGFQTGDLDCPAIDSEENCYYVEEAKWETTSYTPVVVEKAVVYLDAKFWDVNSARFAAYFYTHGNVWVDMELVSSDSTILKCEIPTGQSDVIFCRMNKNKTANDWSNKWNQTGNLKIPADGKNLFTIKQWDGQTSGWSTYSA